MLAFRLLDDVQARFRVDAKLNRAWVETNLITRFSEDASADTHSTSVDGLSYDDATRTFSYQFDGHRTICGRLERRGWWLFQYDELSVDQTACRLGIKIEDRPVDNGFAIVNESFVVVTLEVR